MKQLHVHGSRPEM